jgi:hypothetical protein
MLGEGVHPITWVSKKVLGRTMAHSASSAIHSSSDSLRAGPIEMTCPSKEQPKLSVTSLFFTSKHPT